MTAYRAVVAGLDDMAIVTFECTNCGCAVSISSNSEIKPALVPDTCPSCQSKYDEQIAVAMAALSRFHGAAKTAEKRAGKSIFHFKIKQTA